MQKLPVHANQNVVYCVNQIIKYVQPRLNSTLNNTAHK